MASVRAWASLLLVCLLGLAKLCIFTMPPPSAQVGAAAQAQIQGVLQRLIERQGTVQELHQSVAAFSSGGDVKALRESERLLGHFKEPDEVLQEAPAVESSVRAKGKDAMKFYRADMEQKILAQLAAHSITLVSCGHRDSLRRFHQLELRLSGPHLWQLLSTT